MSMLRSLYQGTRAVQTAVKDANRLREIGVVLARYGFGAMLQRINLAPRDTALPAVSHGSLERRIVDALQELGPTFVKFGQIMSTRTELLPAELCAELGRLQDQVTPVDAGVVVAQITAELGRPIAELFRSFDMTPLASASVAQVHAAVTPAGDEVIVKIRRPGIVKVIDADLSIMHFLARRMEEAIPEARLINLTGMVSEFDRSIRRETDFSLEAGSIERFGRNFEGVDTVHIPRVHRDLSSTAVLTMERVHGVKLTEIATAEIDVDAVARRYLHAAYKMIFQDGFFHGDLHPGNVFLEPDGRIALVDFGMVGRLSGSSRDRLVDVLSALLREDLEDVARTFFDLGHAEGTVDYPAFEAEVIEVVERHFVGRTIREIAIGAFFSDLATIALRFRVRMPADYTMLFKALVTTEGLARRLAPTIDPVELARPFIEELIHQRYAPERLRRTALISGARAASFVTTAMTSGQRILRAIEAGEARVNVAVPEAERGLRRLASARDRQTLVMIAGLLVAAAALLRDAGKPLLFGLPLPALAALAGAGALVVLALMGLMRRADPGPRP